MRLHRNLADVELVGYLLVGPLLVFSILTGTAILAIFLVMSTREMPTSIAVEAFFAIIIVVSLVQGLADPGPSRQPG